MKGQAVEKESLGQRLKRLRKERGYSQITLAEMVGVTDAWISTIELGRSIPSAELINQFAQALKVPVRELLQDEEEAMEIVSRIKLIGVLLETNQPDEAERLIVGLQSHSELSEVDRMKLTVDLGYCRFQQRRYEESLALLQPLILRLESENYHDAYFMATIRNYIGRVYYRIQDFTNALYNFRKAYDFTHRFVMFDSLAAKISYNVGVTSGRIGISQDAIYYLAQAQNFFQKNNKLKDLADTIFVQGLEYNNIKEHSKAAECFDHAKSLFHSLELISWTYKVQLTVATTITLDNDPILATKQLEDCIPSLQQDNDFLTLVLVYIKLATVKLRMESADEAHSYLLNANKLIQENAYHQTGEAGEYHKVFAQYHYSCGNFVDSIEYASKAAELFDRIGVIKDQVECLQVAVDSYEQIGNLKQALLLERKCNQLLLELNEKRGTL